MKKSISFSSDTQNLELVERFVNNICEFEEIDERHFGNILLTLTEGATNAIEHGNQSDVKKRVSIEYSFQENVLSFVIKDEGRGFDHSSIPDPTLPENLEKLTGRGIFLMRSLADKLEFEDEGRMVIINFDLSKSLVTD